MNSYAMLSYPPTHKSRHSDAGLCYGCTPLAFSSLLQHSTCSPSCSHSCLLHAPNPFTIPPPHCNQTALAEHPAFKHTLHTVTKTAHSIHTSESTLMCPKLLAATRVLLCLAQATLLTKAPATLPELTSPRLSPMPPVLKWWVRAGMGSACKTSEGNTCRVEKEKGPAV